MEIEIYGINYNIKYIESNARNDNCMGRSDSKMGEITLNKDMPKDIKLSTLIHEIIEIVSDYNDLELDHRNISVISTGISDVLLKNDIYNILE